MKRFAIFHRRKPPKPRTRAKRILAAVGGFAIALALLFCYGYCFGGPVSQAISRQVAASYVEQAYPGMRYEISLSDKATGYLYIFRIQSTASQDTMFHVWVRLGRIEWDTYDLDVANFASTKTRLETSLKQDVAPALADVGGYDSFYLFWEEAPQQSGGSQPVPAEGYPPFTLDMPYDKANLPPAALVLQMKIDTLPADAAEQAQQLMVRAKAAMDAAGIDIAAYQVVVETPEGHALYSSPVTAAADVAPAATAETAAP